VRGLRGDAGDYGLKNSGRKRWCSGCANKQGGETERIGGQRDFMVCDVCACCVVVVCGTNTCGSGVW